MNTLKTNRRWIAWLVIVCLLYLVEITSRPLAAEATSVEDQGESPTAIEKASPSGASVSKGSILPWILIGLGVVAVGVAVYFLVIKKSKYTLTVTLGTGASGTPAAGSYEYKKGETVNYDYSSSSGYKEVTVKLDSVAAADSGTITMDKDHTLEVNATEGLQEDFTTSADSAWVPKNAPDWSVASGYYIAAGAFPGWFYNYNYYNKAWSQANYTVTVKMKHVLLPGSNGIMLSTGSAMTSASGYSFYFTNETSDRKFSIVKWDNMDYTKGLGVGPATTLSVIKNWTANTNVGGMNTWYTVRIVKNGSNYTLFSNNVALHSFSDTTYDPRYVILFMVGYGVLDELNYDYVYVDVGSTAGSIPGMPAMAVPANPEDLFKPPQR